MLNPGREFRDFQPGQKLENTFTTYHDVLPPDTPPGDIQSHQPCRAVGIECLRPQQRGPFWCGTCHDPHNKPAQPVEYYRSRCLTCHTAKFPAAHPGKETNCIGCHMPRRDAQDGGHTAFTDHRIQRHPQEAQPGAPLDGDIAPWREPAPDLQKRNLGIAYVSAGLQRRSANSLVQGYRLLTEVQQEFSADPEVFTSMGTALLIGKHPSEAEFAFERALELRPNSAVAETNVAAAHQQTGDIDGTILHLERAVALDPMHLPATSALIDLYRQQGNTAKADDLAEKVRSIMGEPSGQLASTAPLNSPKSAETVFKNLKVLDGIPSDQLIPSMRFITASLGVQCVYCHVEGHFDDDSKKAKQTARSMMRMMFAINQNHFEGTREVTCNSCHRGNLRPVDVPAVEEISHGKADAAASPTAQPTTVQPVAVQPTADQIIETFIRALGGTAALEKISTRAGTGKIQVDGKSFDLEFFNKTPDKMLFIQHTSAGNNVTVLDRNSGWISIPGHPVRNIEGFDLEAARLDADLQFALQLALNIKEMFPELRVEYPELVEGRDAYVVVGTRAGQASWKFFFDVRSGLLVRLVRYANSPLGLDPTQIDYGDYRSVDGVQTPFTRTIARAGSRSTIHIDAIQQNVPIDESKFVKPVH